PDLSAGPGVLPVLTPDVLDVRRPLPAEGVAHVDVLGRVAADGVALGDEDGVGGAVGNAGREAGHAAELPGLVPAAAEDMPVHGVTGGPAIAPGLAVGGQARVARGLEGLDRGVRPPGVGRVRALPVRVAGATTDLGALVDVVLFDVGQQEVE